jgi:alpha-tubulin suppressor-like RCC1 family protein
VPDVGLSGVPLLVPGPTGTTDLAAGSRHSCAILANGEVSCWGWADFGELGVPQQYMGLPPATIPGGFQAQKLAAGLDFTCAIVNQGVECWGDNENQSLGRTLDAGTQDSTPTPVSPALSKVDALRSCPECSTMCALIGGTVSCWGNGIAAPTAIPGVTDAADVAVEAWAEDGAASQIETIFVLSTSGDVGWTRPMTNGGYAPYTSGYATGIATIAGGSSVCVIAANGGAESCAALDNCSTVPPPLTPTNVKPSATAIDYLGSYMFRCALTVNGVECAGSNLDGQLGNGLPARVLEPKKIVAEGVSSLFMGPDCTTAAFACGGALQAWGNCAAYDSAPAAPYVVPKPPTAVQQLGPLDAIKPLVFTGPSMEGSGEDDLAYVHLAAQQFGLLESPQGIPTSRLDLTAAYTTIVPGPLYDVALGSTGTISFYIADATANDTGIFGNGSLGSGDAPVGNTVTLAGPWAGIATATWADHMCAWKADGSLYCWGANNQGQVGNGTMNGNVLTPTPILVGASVGLDGGTGVAKVTSAVVGANHTCALTDQGDVYCWGYNGEGEVGGLATDYDTPQRVRNAQGQPIHGFTHLASSDRNICGTLASGAVCWGANDNGETGNGRTGSDGKPYAVLHLPSTPLTSISAGAQTMCAVDATSAVWCWGASPNGEVGDGSQQYPPSYVHVGL